MDNAWNLLKEYDLFSKNTIDADFMCVLCEKILIDPRVCPCGCRYCKICIENYLDKGDNICPGTTDECKEEKLDLINNINIDHVIIKKISKLILNCPIESCKFSDQLINMRQHLIVCRESAFKCSFSVNGCNFISLSQENVDKHCEMSKDKHLELVLLENENMKNNNNLLNKDQVKLQQEIEMLKNNSAKLKTENDDDKDKLKQNQETINNLQSQIKIKTTEIADYKRKYEYEINTKNILLKHFSDYLVENGTEFIWKFDNLSEINEQRRTVYSDEFFIFKNEIKMQLTMANADYKQYTRGYNSYQINAIVSFLNPPFRNCPFVGDITIGIININSQNFISSCKGNLSFDNFCAFQYLITHFDVTNFGINQLNYLMLKCIVNWSVDKNKTLLNN